MISYLITLVLSLINWVMIVHNEELLQQNVKIMYTNKISCLYFCITLHEYVNI